MSTPSVMVSPISRRAVGVEAADDFELAEPQHGDGLGAGRLDHLDRRGRCVAMPGLRRCRSSDVAVDVLGPHAEDDASALARPQAPAAGSGKAAPRRRPSTGDQAPPVSPCDRSRRG